MFAQVKELTHWPNDADDDSLELYRWIVRLGFAGVLLFVACASPALHRASLRRRSHPLHRRADRAGAGGATLLEISRMHGIPHAAVCGGRARCSTCRVRIDGASALTPPGDPEAITLASIDAPPNVRLACQIRPASALTVTRLLRPASTGPGGGDLQEIDSAGVEKPLAVMFLDMRDFTQLSQSRLPYDIVFILNEFFAATGSAITPTAAGSTSSWATACSPCSASATAWRSAAGRRCVPRAPSTWRSITSMPSSAPRSASRCGSAWAFMPGRC